MYKQDLEQDEITALSRKQVTNKVGSEMPDEDF